MNFGDSNRQKIDRSRLIALLREGKSYISGQEICETFGVSRNAVWKAIEDLRREGYEIEAVRNRGYRMTEDPDVFSRNEILSRLKTGYIGRELYFYDKTDSTNIRIRQLSDTTDTGCLAVADMQEAGRGRRGRGWVSPAGTNIYMSLLLKPDIDPSDAPMITLLMALAVAGGIRHETGLDARIKWPNDIVVNGKKVCGILTEMELETDYIRDAIVGIGINVNQGDISSFPEEIRNTATSLRIEGGKSVMRAALVADIMNGFEGLYEDFLRTGNLSSVRKDYEELLVSLNKEVRVLDPKGEYDGISRGINEKGELLVEVSDGSIRPVYAGEVSVRGIYGYV